VGAVDVTNGELIGFDLAHRPCGIRWTEAMQALRSWSSVHAAFSGWCEMQRAA
jgi:hypothetical protein